MKKLSYLSLAAAVLLMGACSNDEILDGAGPGTGSTTGGAAVAGYINLGINLPTTPKAAKADPTFDDGDPNEYAVNDAILVVFEKAADKDEDGATFRAAYDLDLRPWLPEDETDQITTHADMVAQVPAKVEDDSKLYALVMLNAGKLFAVKDSKLYAKANIDAGDYNVEIANFGDLNNREMALSAGGAATAVQSNVGFFMANAPLSAANGASYTTLVELKDENICTTAQAAQNKPATSIYVERAVSKVTIGSVNTTLPTTGNYANDQVQFTGWALDITNRSFYPVRNMKQDGSEGFSDWKDYTDEANPARFYGNTTVADGLYRTYWAIDPNYKVYTTFADAVADATGTKLDGEFSLLSSTDALSTALTEPQYCLENTFDVNNQNQNQTTRVVFAAIYTPAHFQQGQDFYMIGSSTALYYLTEDEAKYGYGKDEESGSSLYPTEGVTNIVVDKIKEVIMENEALAEALHIFNESQITIDTKTDNFVKGPNTLSAENATIKYTPYKKNADNTDPDAPDYAAPETDGSVPAGYTAEAPVTLTEAQYSTVAAALGTINCYKSGVSYYAAYLRHFTDIDATGNGDVLPLEDVAEQQYAFDNNYHGSNAYYLGRYGLVRNNWYELSVNSVSGPGSSTIPGRDPQTDDQQNYYISVDVNVLSWALRQQNVNL